MKKPDNIKNNFVAKHMNKFNKPKVEPNRKKQVNSKYKHKYLNEEE